MQKDDFKAIVWESRGITEARDPGLLPQKDLGKYASKQYTIQCSIRGSIYRACTTPF